MRPFDHPGIAKVAATLAEAGFASEAERIHVLDEDVRTAAQAAATVGVEVGAIANSLLFRAPGDATGEQVDTPLLVLTSGAHRAEIGLLSELVRQRSASSAASTEVAGTVRMAKPDFVRAHTGQVIGGVAPLGHPSPVRTIVDSTLDRYPAVWAAAGHPKAVFPTTLRNLLAMTGGASALVTREDDQSR